MKEASLARTLQRCPRVTAGLRKVRTVVSVVLIIVANGQLSGAAFAAGSDIDYPTRPIRIIDPFPPGGATDFIDRIVARKLSERLGQPVVVDNRAGAAGNLAAELAAHAAPDGYTLHMNLPIAMATARILYPDLRYDPLKDFAYVSLVAKGAYVLVTNPALGARSLADLVELAKSKPGQLRYGSTGVGNLPHLAFELLARRTQINIIHVPYKGAGPLVTGLLGGEIQLAFVSPPGAASLVKAGKLTALAVSSSRRTANWPQLPTIAESGYLDYDVTPSYGYVVPRGTPAQMLNKLNAALGKILDLPDVGAAFDAQGLEAVHSSPEKFRQMMNEELLKWKRVIKEADIKGEN